MAAKAFLVEAIGTTVHVYKRRGTKSLRLSISPDGKVRVTIPMYATYSEAMRFVNSRRLWIQENLPASAPLLLPGQHIGKAHRLVFKTEASEAVRTRLAGSEVQIVRPPQMSTDHPDVQAAAARASLKAMRLEAAKLLPVRLRQLAEKYDFAYTAVSVKQLKGRWGSCDTHRHITLNLFLMQLPWHLIDYVLLHELVHTKHLNHSSDFWEEFLRHEPRAKQYRSQIRTQKPVLKAVSVTPPVA